MFGLVSTSPASGLWQIVQRFWFGAPAPVAIRMPEPLTLEQEVAAMGIRTVPLKKVRAYQKRYLKEQKNAGLAGNLAEWLIFSPESFRLGVGVIPADVDQTIRRVETIPDARVLVERFWEDPFVFVVRQKDGRREEACVGYWNAPGFKP